MSRQNLIRGAVAASTGFLLSLSSLSAQEITEPLPSTPNPGGGVLAPDEADGVPNNEERRPARPGVDAEVVPERDVVPPARDPRQSAPMTAEDLQTWQQIARLHEQFVRSQVPGAGTSQDIARTDPNRQRLQRLWERLAEIERQLIVSGAYSDEIATRTVTRVRPVPRRDLDEVPDPLTASNQRVKDTENDEDTATARALAQEDRSPPPKPLIRRDTLREAARRDPLTAEAIDDSLQRGVDNEVVEVAPPAGDTSALWQEFIEVRRQILIAEIAAARSVAQEP